MAASERWRRFFGLAVGVSLLLAACSGGAPQQPSAGAPSGPSGSLTLVLNAEPPDVTAATTARNTGILRNIYEALLNRDPVTMELVPELALSWELVSPTVWRFKLREGVSFHDGSPFNAEAAAFGLNYIWNRSRPGTILARMGPDLNAVATSQYVVDVTTVRPDPILPLRFYLSGIPSMKALKEDPASYPLKAIGTGPYRFVEWVKGTHLKIEAYPDWWGNKSANAKDARGVQTFKEASYVFRADSQVRAAMVKTGEADFTRILASKEQCSDLPSKCLTKVQVETVFLRIDTPHPLLKDLRIRKAIALAIDKNALMNTVLGGGELAGQMVGPSALGHNAKLQPYPFDMTQAKALVNEVKNAGVDVRMPLLLVARQALISRVAEAIEFVAISLNTAGLNVKAELWEPIRNETMLTAPHPHDPNRNILVLHQHGNEMMDFAATVNSYFRCEGTQSSFCDRTIDELHTKADQLTGKERDAAYQDIAAKVYDMYATIPIGRPHFYWGLSNKVKWQPRVDGMTLLKEMVRP